MSLPFVVLCRETRFIYFFRYLKIFVDKFTENDQLTYITNIGRFIESYIEKYEHFIKSSFNSFNKYLSISSIRFVTVNLDKGTVSIKLAAFCPTSPKHSNIEIETDLINSPSLYSFLCFCYFICNNPTI